jgi:hypothetical protein
MQVPDRRPTTATCAAILGSPDFYIDPLLSYRNSSCCGFGLFGHLGSVVFSFTHAACRAISAKSSPHPYRWIRCSILSVPLRRAPLLYITIAFPLRPRRASDNIAVFQAVSELPLLLNARDDPTTGCNVQQVAALRSLGVLSDPTLFLCPTGADPTVQISCVVSALPAVVKTELGVIWSVNTGMRRGNDECFCFFPR